MVKQEFTQKEIEFQEEYTPKMINDFAQILGEYALIVENDDRVCSKAEIVSTMMFLSMSNVIADYAIYSHGKDLDSIKSFFNGVPFCIKGYLHQIMKKYEESKNNSQ